MSFFCYFVIGKQGRFFKFFLESKIVSTFLQVMMVPAGVLPTTQPQVMMVMVILMMLMMTMIVIVIF